jgi:hypothetical protein
MKLTLETADNGFIVKVKDSGEGMLKDLYIPKKMVFEDFNDLVGWLKETLAKAVK